MNLSDKLLQIKPELSGAIASNSFDFQKNWAICKVVDLHEKGDDYAVTLEYYDDVTVLDSSSTPTKASFYQVKSRKADITTADLIRRNKGKDKLGSSILGKLYVHKIKFDAFVESLNVVSNAHFKVKLPTAQGESTSKDFICCKDMEKDEIDRMRTSLKSEHNLSSEPVFEDITFLIVTDISSDNHAMSTMGKLMAFISKRFPSAVLVPEQAYRKVFDEVNRRSNKSMTCHNTKELISLKSVSRDNFEQILALIASNDASRQKRDRIKLMLSNQRVSAGNLMKFADKWNTFDVARIKGDSVFIKISKLIKRIVDGLTPAETIGTLWECANVVLAKFRKVSPSLEIYNDDQFLLVVILAEMDRD